MIIRSYSELITFDDFFDRFEYLKLGGVVGEETFGYDRYLNQMFYQSDLWKKDVRPWIISRDNGCDLGCPDRPIVGAIYVHHMNPITIDDIVNRTAKLTDEENLICCSFMTHQAISYGDSRLLQRDPIVRKPNDTCPWRC